MATGRLLIVDDEVRITNVLVRTCSRVVETHPFNSFEDAMNALGSHDDWSGFIVDVSLGDGSGLDLLATAINRFPRSAAAIVSGSNAPASINRAFEMGATYLCKPFDAAALDTFLERVLAVGAASDDPILVEVKSIAAKHGLSPREAEIVAWMATGGERDTFIKRVGISEATMKTHVRNVLLKCGAVSLDGLVADILRNVVRTPRAAR
ncbi:MAG: response regulator [Polyangiaceae bacterium]